MNRGRTEEGTGSKMEKKGHLGEGDEGVRDGGEGTVRATEYISVGLTNKVIGATLEN